MKRLGGVVAVLAALGCLGGAYEAAGGMHGYQSFRYRFPGNLMDGGGIVFVAGAVVLFVLGAVLLFGRGKPPAPSR